MDGKRQDGDRNVLLRERVATNNLAAIRDVIDDRAAGLGLPSADVRRFLVAVNEAATNAIRHAAGVGEVIVWYDGNRLVAEIHDEGAGIDQARQPALPSVEALSGRGLWLMHQLVDQVSIVNGPGGALVRLEVSCTANGDQ